MSNISGLFTIGKDAETAGEDDKFRAKISVVDSTFMGGKTKEERREKEISTWFNITLWDKYAKSMVPHMTKGKQFYISGNCINRKYQKDGEEKYSLEIVNAKFEFVREGSGGQPQETSGSKSASTPDDNPPDMPF